MFDEFDFLDDVVDMPNGFRSFSLKDKSWSPIDVLCCEKLEPGCCPPTILDGDSSIDFLLLP